LIVPFVHAYTLINASGEVLSEGGALSKPFQLASVTKLIVAMGALLAVDRQLLDLDQAAGPAESTIRHLLSHASGLAFEGDGTVISARVGKRRIYSNQGYELLGVELSNAVGAPAGKWIERELLAPLGALHTSIAGSFAHSGISTAADLSLVAAELLAPRVLSADAVERMQSPAFPGLRGVLPGYGFQADNLWGLGPEIKGTKTPHWMAAQSSPQTFGHFGQSGSFLWVDPDSKQAGLFLGDEPFGPWHKENWPVFNQELIDN
jgi:Beta-lactamase class C and other penicillin binding proteins